MARKKQVSQSAHGDVEKLAKERVSKGAAFLDTAHAGWAGKIRLNDLNLCRDDTCPLGQLYGWFSDGLNALGIGVEQKIDLGFWPMHDGYGLGCEPFYRAAWRREVVKRVP